MGLERGDGAFKTPRDTGAARSWGDHATLVYCAQDRTEDGCGVQPVASRHEPILRREPPELATKNPKPNLERRASTHDCSAAPEPCIRRQPLAGILPAS